MPTTPGAPHTPSAPSPPALLEECPLSPSERWASVLLDTQPAVIPTTTAAKGTPPLPPPSPTRTHVVDTPKAAALVGDNQENCQDETALRTPVSALRKHHASSVLQLKFRPRSATTTPKATPGTQTHQRPATASMLRQQQPYYPSSPASPTGHGPSSVARISVVVRVKPNFQNDNNAGTTTAASIQIKTNNNSSSTSSIHIIDNNGHSHDAHADRIFGPDASESHIFDAVGRGAVDGVLRGVNQSLLAYGATGSGKTHTLGFDNKEGLTPRVLAYLTKEIARFGGDCVVTTKASFFEVYNEGVYDLLRPTATTHDKHDGDSNKLKVFGGTVKGAEERTCRTLEQLQSMLEMGVARRAAASTASNARSSRSHAIFKIFVARRRADGTMLKANLFLVDLAGAESLEKSSPQDAAATPAPLPKTPGRGGYYQQMTPRTPGTPSRGMAGLEASGRQAEGRAINLSLLTLKRVVESIGEGKQHIPWRESNLTMLLRDAIGGNSRTSICACVADDSAADVSRSINTLRFAVNAQRVICEPVVNASRELEAEKKQRLEAEAAAKEQRDLDAKLAEAREEERVELETRHRKAIEAQREELRELEAALVLASEEKERAVQAARREALASKREASNEAERLQRLSKVLETQRRELQVVFDEEKRLALEEMRIKMLDEHRLALQEVEARHAQALQEQRQQMQEGHARALQEQRVQLEKAAESELAAQREELEMAALAVLEEEVERRESGGIACSPIEEEAEAEQEPEPEQEQEQEQEHAKMAQAWAHSSVVSAIESPEPAATAPVDMPAPVATSPSSSYGLGARITKLFDDGNYYEGTVTATDAPGRYTHVVTYDDGDVESYTLNQLRKQCQLVSSSGGGGGDGGKPSQKSRRRLLKQKAVKDVDSPSNKRMSVLMLNGEGGPLRRIAQVEHVNVHEAIKAKGNSKWRGAA
ncbi:hypothetical protein PPROV_000568400 [Pycnococcus provasolii]|uniref:Kinesin motor domain-containing protein n=1 Tax=Pycnococcus provasolii TaxID=41880 RepID=A0A830HMB4_9CHLO|nr:hypothetical protein PPROV_000568400 [Pycnococcus provasolii]